MWGALHSLILILVLITLLLHSTLVFDLETSAVRKRARWLRAVIPSIIPNGNEAITDRRDLKPRDRLWAELQRAKKPAALSEAQREDQACTPPVSTPPSGLLVSVLQRELSDTVRSRSLPVNHLKLDGQLLLPPPPHDTPCRFTEHRGRSPPR